ncbi:hypothetical protein PoB_001834300 [Plakobranchus ocellatus]|uniref:Uncharacterized protein n=1 Tax=Plakobranchus ocellatus TaxID=259542 RepID=A0AAV3ZBN6_9GAST|nr:hypothetical protein PoB_001834300 [Plakobranchus ocellatus]
MEACVTVELYYRICARCDYKFHYVSATHVATVSFSMVRVPMTGSKLRQKNHGTVSGRLPFFCATNDLREKAREEKHWKKNLHSRNMEKRTQCTWVKVRQWDLTVADTK